MIQLKTKHGVGYQTAFYFHTMEQCNEFMYTMRNHMMNVPWEKPIESSSFPEVEERSERGYWVRRHLEESKSKSGKELAESNLHWANAFCQNANIGLTSSQKSFISTIVSRM